MSDEHELDDTNVLTENYLKDLLKLVEEIEED